MRVFFFIIIGLMRSKYVFYCNRNVFFFIDSTVEDCEFEMTCAADSEHDELELYTLHLLRNDFIIRCDKQTLLTCGRRFRTIR